MQKILPLTSGPFESLAKSDDKVKSCNFLQNIAANATLLSCLVDCLRFDLHQFRPEYIKYSYEES